MKTKYQSLFPSILSIEALASKIEEDVRLRRIFSKWNCDEQMKFFDICTGICSPCSLWDDVIQEVFMQGTNHLLLCGLLECTLGGKIERAELLPGKEVLPDCDVTCMLKAQIWMQKECSESGHGDSLPETAEIYKIRKNQSNNRMKTPVIQKGNSNHTIVLYESCPDAFRGYEECYIHHGEQRFDTGVKVREGNECCLVMLDVFLKTVEQLGVQNHTDAWIALLAVDNTELLWNLLIEYPMLWAMYDSFYDMCSCKLNLVMEAMDEKFMMQRKEYDKCIINGLHERTKYLEQELYKKELLLERKLEEIQLMRGQSYFF